MKKVLKNYRLPVSLVEKLDRYAEALGIDRTQLIEETLEHYLDAQARKLAGERRAKLENTFQSTAARKFKRDAVKSEKSPLLCLSQMPPTRNETMLFIQK
ncbi:ribbon-helix-helix protein, CopG family [Fontisphaera persica]|uniref:CopG family ribbon-helix-helix protein n=1 Tax=Fontisphaera persica TaxID=2974023 RepID=UPI0024C02DFF|nr:ribbon-helix-helix protein, CopG family [Fontisphaera persica]WCJ60994.1 ribbon-helix-helix protein, CopG family [Fontisphaera persica]